MNKEEAADFLTDVIVKNYGKEFHIADWREAIKAVNILTQPQQKENYSAQQIGTMRVFICTVNFLKDHCNIKIEGIRFARRLWSLSLKEAKDLYEKAEKEQEKFNRGDFS